MLLKVPHWVVPYSEPDVKKQTSQLTNCFSNLGPGAESLMQSIDDPSAPASKQLRNKEVRFLDLKDWARIVQAFHDWPFAPEVSWKSCALFGVKV
jgi:hypothetical protein